MTATAPVQPGAHFVYLLSADEGHYWKLGYSGDPRARVESLQPGCPFRIELMGVWPFETEAAARRAEKIAHAEASASRLSGEWFDVAGLPDLQRWPDKESRFIWA